MQVREVSPPGRPPRTVSLDTSGRVIVSRGAANSAALLRLGLGLLYLWAFISQGLRCELHQLHHERGREGYVVWPAFSYDASLGWITSAFAHSPTAAFIGSTHGPLAFIAQDLPTGIDDFGWMFALGGLGVALTLGICMRIAGWGGFLLNIFLWFSLFPPNGNPIIDGEHMAFALSLLLLAFLHAGNRFGLGRWWEAHTPALIH